MKLVDVSAALRTRLIADSTLVNTYLGASGNVVMGQLPKSSDVSGNIIVYNIYGDGSTDTADQDIDHISIQFTVMARRDGAQGPDAALLILDRLRGDAKDQPGNVPTYGLHLHKLVLTGAAASTHAVMKLQRVSYGPVDVPNPDTYVAYEATYSGYIQTI